MDAIRPEDSELWESLKVEGVSFRGVKSQYSDVLQIVGLHPSVEPKYSLFHYVGDFNSSVLAEAMKYFEGRLVANGSLPDAFYLPPAERGM